MTWRDLASVRENWLGKILLKGILDVEDARQAASASADGLVVSNHGDRLEVLMDGGVRSGLDVVKALAQGARASLLGRAWGYAAAARGEAGVADMLATMRSEMKVALALCGVTDVAKLDRAVLLENRTAAAD